MKTSLKSLILSHLKNIYPQEMSSGDIEDFASTNNYNGETGRKRCGDLIKSGLVKTETRTIIKKDGTAVIVAFHKAIMEEKEPKMRLEEMPEYDIYKSSITPVQQKMI
jgi:hypothetical protein